MRVIGDRLYLHATIAQGKATSELLLALQSTYESALMLDTTVPVGVEVPTTIEGVFIDGLHGDTGQGNVGRVELLRLGAFDLKSVPVEFPDVSLFAHLHYRAPGANGYLGADVLNRFDWVIDVEGRRILLRPAAGYRTSIDYNLSGIKLAIAREAGYLMVADVLPNSAAAQAGLVGGDVITSIDSRSTRELSRRTARQLLEKPLAGVRRAALGIQRLGREVTLVYSKDSL